MAQFREGDLVYLDYGVAGDPWHERLLLRSGHQPLEWYVLTPDEDVYIEPISMPPRKAVRAGQPNGLLPPGLGARAGQPVYRFTRPPTAMSLQFQKFRRLADEMYARELDGTPMLEVTDGADLEALASPEEVVWLTLMPPRLGEAVPSDCVDPRTVRGDVGAAKLPGGGWVAVQRVPPAERDEWTRAAAAAAFAGLTPREGARGSPAPLTDARTLAVLRNTSGERFRSVQSAADALQEEQFEDWALDGPRTAACWLREVARTGTSVLARHHVEAREWCRRGVSLQCHA